jgi:hypothetical protein
MVQIPSVNIVANVGEGSAEVLYVVANVSEVSAEVLYVVTNVSEVSAEVLYVVANASEVSAEVLHVVANVSEGSDCVTRQSQTNNVKKTSDKQLFIKVELLYVERFTLIFINIELSIVLQIWWQRYI